MAGADDVVKAALKLIAGGAKEAAPKAAIRAYHVSPHDFDMFKPSEFRGSTFFSSTPERAKRGAEAGRNEMVMETATELPPVNWRTYEVEIDPSRVKGLSLTPSESKWFEGLPGKIVGDDALAEATKGIPPGMYWDDFYDEAPVAEGVYEYIKKPTPPSISYEDAISKNRDIYRKQWPHYAGAATDEKSSASRLNEQGMGGYLVQDEGGLSFAINDPSIVKILRKYANGGSIRQGYGPGGWVDDVVKMAGKVISGEGEDAAKAGIRAYQGSPHNFAAERLVRFPEGRTEYIVGQPDVLPDVPEGAEVLQDFPLGRMRMDKIGTGEGAQVYGHGLYLAEHEPIAVNYRDVLTDRASTFRVGNYDMPKWILRGIENAPDRAAAIAKYKEDFANRLLEAQKEAEGSVQPWLASGRISSAKDILAGLDALETGAPLPHTKGRVYEISLSADPKTDFINYDAPWEDQPQKVKEAFSYLAKNRPDGSDLARRIEAPIFAQEASDMGVKGIQYLDAGSRGTVAPAIKPKDGKFEVYWGNDPRPVDTFATREAAEAAAREIDGRTRNYVVFDDKLISIIRKYGIAGASAMLGYNLMDQLDPKQALAASMADQDYQASRPQRSMGGNNSISGALNVARGLNGAE